jgi:hypothetical protein
VFNYLGIGWLVVVAFASGSGNSPGFTESEESKLPVPVIISTVVHICFSFQKTDDRK